MYQKRINHIEDCLSSNAINSKTGKPFYPNKKSAENDIKKF